MKSFIVLLAIALGCLGYWYLHRPITYLPGVLIADDPSQIMLPADTPAFAQGAFKLKPLGVFSIDARVLHRKIYRAIWWKQMVRELEPGAVHSAERIRAMAPVS